MHGIIDKARNDTVSKYNRIRHRQYELIVDYKVVIDCLLDIRTTVTRSGLMSCEIFDIYDSQIHFYETIPMDRVTFVNLYFSCGNCYILLVALGKCLL